MKTLIESPKLAIDSTRDGVWLHFATLDGRHTSLNIPVMFGRIGTFNDETIFQWAVEYARANPPNAEVSDSRPL